MIGQTLIQNNTDSQTARCLLRHIGHIRTFSMQECMQEAGVSKASLHRFYHSAGFRSFSEMTEKLAEEQQNHTDLKNHGKLRKQSLSALVSDMNQAGSVLFYGDPEILKDLNQTMRCLENNGVSAVILTSWDLSAMYDALDQLEESDLFVHVEPEWTLHNAYEMSMNNRWYLNLNKAGMGNYRKYYLGGSEDGKQMGYHTIQVLPGQISVLDAMLEEMLKRKDPV